MGESSPERSRQQKSAHRRMQSLQQGSVRDLSLMIEGSGPRTQSPEKKDISTTKLRDPFVDDRDERALVTSSGPRPGPSLTPIVRPTARRSQQSILGEKTPPQSATMLALQHMSMSPETARQLPHPPSRSESAKEPGHDHALANVSNNSTALVRAPQSLDALSTQILSLTGIATSLQKEMSQLSRRSRDNATDLLSLKEATNTRDEDIRKSLRELKDNLAEARARAATRDLYGGALLLDSKPHHAFPMSSPPTLSTKTFSSIGSVAGGGGKINLPRIPSPNSFAASLDRESMSTPSLYGPDAPATIALLEKIVRDMGTKDGQELLLSRLSELSDRLAGMATATKVDELKRAVESSQQERAVAPSASNGGGGNGTRPPHNRSASFDDGGEDRQLGTFNRAPPSSGQLTALHNEPRRSSAPAAGSVVNEEVIRAIKTVKDSISQGGGLTAEVKALVRELRGEVLGMGREIGRRLDETAAKSHDRPASATREEMTKVVAESLDEMKVHINELVKEHRRQSAASVVQAVEKGRVDYQEVYNAMRAALRDAKGENEGEDLRREDVLEAVKEAWEAYKPEIEIQTVGLEREEILACLQEGLTAASVHAGREDAATREEVFEAVVEGLKHFSPPRVETPATLSRDEILEAVRECLEEFEFPNPFPDGGNEGVSKEDVLDAVKIGLQSHELAKEEERITRGDVLDAIHEGLQTTPPAVVGITKEDVIDAVQIGLEGVDFPEREAGLTREDVVQAIREELAQFQGMLGHALVPASNTAEGGLSKEDVLDAVHRGLEGFELPSAETSRGVNVSISKDDIVDAVREGLSNIELPDLSSALVPSSSGTHHTDTTELKERLQDILEFMRAEFKAVSDEAKQNVAANGRDTEQVLDATKDGFEKLRADMEAYVDKASGQAGQEEFLINLVRSLDGFREEVAELVAKSSDGSRDVIRDEIESLREAVNSSLVPAVPQAAIGGGGHKEILEALQEGLSGLRTEISSRPIAGVNEILDALQEGLGDLRISIDRLKDKPADFTANDEILDALKAGLDGVRSDIDVLREESKNDKQLVAVGDMPSLPDDVVKTGDIKHLQEDMAKQQDIQHLAADMVRQEDIKKLETLLKDLQVKVESMETPTALRAVGTEAGNGSGLSKDDLSLMEDTLRGLQDAVASVSDTVAGMSVSVLGVSDTVTGVNETVLGVQEKVAAMATPEARAASDPSTREDVQAIETILRNTKSRLDDLIDGEQAVRKEHIDVLETLILETRESLSGLSSHLDSVSKKEDVDVVGSLVTQVVAAFDEMKERHEKALEDPEKVTKTDVEAVEAVCFDVKNLVEQVVKADLAALPSKEDLTRIEDLLRDFKGKMDEETEEKSKALDVYKLENVGVSDRVTEVKTLLEEFQGVVKEKLDQGASGVSSIQGLLDSLGETINKNATIGDDLKDMFLVMKDEFEESKAGVVGAKLDTDEKFQTTTDAILARFDEKMGELVTKYDDFQLVMEDRASKGEARDTEMEAAVVGTKAIADELKMLIDTLGSTVTESMEKMEEASKTVFTRVEDLLAKSDDNHGDAKAEHQLTREQILEARTLVEGLKGDVTEYQPQILESIKDVLLMVGQHYEHSKAATLEMQEAITNKIEEAKPEPLMLSDVPKYDDTGLHEKLDKLVGHTAEADKAFEQFQTLDAVHRQVVQTAAEISAFLAAQTKQIEDEHEDREKTLQETNLGIERRTAEKEALEAGIAALQEENERLRQEHQDELEGFRVQRQEELTLHKQQRDEETERLKLEREEALTLLETQRQEEMDRLKLEHAEEEARFRASLREEEDRFKASLREQEERSKMAMAEEEARFKASLAAEADRQRELLQRQEDRFTAGLREEEERLKTGLASLRAEQDSLAKQKMRLSADLSSLETALRLRREELQDMEARAEGLERRILEGVMDHSRVLLLAKANRSSTTAHNTAKDPMARKRVPSTKVKDLGLPTAPIKADTKPKTAMKMALSRSGTPQTTPNRRILSLSQINNNVAAGGPFVRSKSVRQGGGMRKSSWAGGKGYGDLTTPRESEVFDKENLLQESDEDGVVALPKQSKHLDVVDILPLATADSEMTLAERDFAYDQDDGDATETEGKGRRRRESRGTVTATERSYDGTGTDGDYYSDTDGESRYARSEWTDSALGTESYVSSKSEGKLEGKGGEVVVYGAV
jgi:DNA repair exonuclease SbcCD ATPase subunit